MGLHAGDSDEAWARLARTERDAFGELVRRYADRIFNLAYRMTGDRSAAEDLAQEAFLRAYRALPGFKEGHPFSPWLYRIALNVCLTHSQRQRATPTDRLDEDMAAQIFDPAPSVEDLIERREVQTTVQQAILALPLRYRAAVILYHLEGRSYTDIADILGLPVNTVRTHLHRGREMLRETLRQSGLRHEGTKSPKSPLKLF